MSAKNISNQNSILESKTDWHRLKLMKEKDIIAGAKADPDAPLLTKAELSKFKRVHSPNEVNVKSIRNKLHLSQEQFAKYFGVSIRTLQEWEQNRRKPTATARNFLTVIAREPKAVLRALSSL